MTLLLLSSSSVTTCNILASSKSSDYNGSSILPTNAITKEEFDAYLHETTQDDENNRTEQQRWGNGLSSSSSSLSFHHRRKDNSNNSSSSSSSSSNNDVDLDGNNDKNKDKEGVDAISPLLREFMSSIILKNTTNIIPDNAHSLCTAISNNRHRNQRKKHRRTPVILGMTNSNRSNNNTIIREDCRWGNSSSSNSSLLLLSSSVTTSDILASSESSDYNGNSIPTNAITKEEFDTYLHETQDENITEQRWGNGLSSSSSSSSFHHRTNNSNKSDGCLDDDYMDIAATSSKIQKGKALIRAFGAIVAAADTPLIRPPRRESLK
jgi:hypothetical protein